jgi:DNA-binding transcriptional ArsR family regulator
VERTPSSCKPGDHGHADLPLPPVSLERAADLFRAMADAPRLRILDLLKQSELCVTEIVAAVNEKFSTVSQRLRILRKEGLIVRRREGNHLYYALSDRHVADLIQNALAHAVELETAPGVQPSGRRLDMAANHEGHTHQHGPNCGHTGVVHEGHVDYLHDGHLHHVQGAKVEEHSLAVSGANPAACTPKHDCGGHDKSHKHGPKCGHEGVPHGDHTDYLVNGHLHHPHGDHCDDHGPVKKA